MAAKNENDRDTETQRYPANDQKRSTTFVHICLLLMPVWCFLVLGIGWLQPRWYSENQAWYATFLLAASGVIAAMIRRDRWEFKVSLYTLLLMLAISLMLPYINRVTD